MLRKLLVGSAPYILGPFGSDLRRHGEKIASRGGKNAKKRAVVAVARKLAVLLHTLWVTGEAYEPLYNTHRRQEQEAAQCQAKLHAPPFSAWGSGCRFLPDHDATWRSLVHPKKRYSLKLVEVRGFSEVKVAKRMRRELPEICRCPVRVGWTSPERSMIHRYLSGWAT